MDNKKSVYIEVIEQQWHLLSYHYHFIYINPITFGVHDSFKTTIFNPRIHSTQAINWTMMPSRIVSQQFVLVHKFAILFSLSN